MMEKVLFVAVFAEWYRKRSHGLHIMLFLSFLLSPQGAFADSTVKKISKKQTRIIVDGDYSRGTKLCVFDDNDNKIACGKVSKSNGSDSIINFKKGGKFNKIKVGFSVREEGAKSGESSSAGEKFMIHFSFSPQALSPISYNLLTYQNPDNGVPPNTLWSNYATQNNSFEGKELHKYSLLRTLSFGFDYLFTSSVGAGLKLRLKIPTKPSPLVATNYSPIQDRNNEYVETATSHRGNGFYLSGIYRKQISSNSTLYFSGGLDFESAKVSLLANKKDDKDPNLNLELFRAEAKLMVASLRSDAIYTYYLGAFGIDLGLGVLLPMSEMSKSFTASYLESDENNAQLADPLTDLEKSLAMKKNSFGLEVFLGSRFKF